MVVYRPIVMGGARTLFVRQFRHISYSSSSSRAFRSCPLKSRTFFSGSAAAAGHHAASSLGPSPPVLKMMGALVEELDRLAPRFEIQASQVEIYLEPTEFYEALKRGILRAKRRVFLSTLYIGKGQHELVDTIRTALKKQPNLKVSILTDALRGTREAPGPCCASLLTELVKEFGPDRVDIRMYHTPNLTGLSKRLVPKRYNEGWGLQHMKIYGFDDEVILSGANLSEDYFTNRQDRYHAFACKDLSDYYEKVHSSVCKFSFRVDPVAEEPAGFKLVWPETNVCPSPLDDTAAFRSAATSLIAPLLRPKEPPSQTQSGSSKTYIYPIGQFTPVLRSDNPSTEHPGLLALLKVLSDRYFSASEWVFTAGYFNLHSDYQRLLLSAQSMSGTIITAAPQANGFYGSAGLSGFLPEGYLVLVQRFLRSVHSARRDGKIDVLEWRRGTVGEPGGWTYHAKGIWITPPHLQNPSITVVGSSNYTRRSHALDLEINALVITEDEELQKKLGDEVNWLMRWTKKLTLEEFETEERKIDWRTRVLLWITGRAL